MSYVPAITTNSYQNNNHTSKKKPWHNRSVKTIESNTNQAPVKIERTLSKSIIQQNIIHNQTSEIKIKAEEITSQNPFINRFDDKGGIFFTHSLKFLKVIVNEIIENIKNEKSLLIFKCIRLADGIKKQIPFEKNSLNYFLAAFQICAYLPSDYQNHAWKYLVQDFKNISFKDTSPLLHSLHQLTFIREHSFTSLLSFLNILTFIYHGEKELDSPDITKLNCICPVEMSLLKISHQSEKANLISAIHLRTTSHFYTLEIPLNIFSAIDAFLKEISLNTFLDLMPCSLPKLIAIKDLKPVLENLRAVRFFTNQKIEQFAKHLITVPNNYLANLGFRIILSLNYENRRVNVIFKEVQVNEIRKELAILTCLDLIIKKITLLPCAKFVKPNDIHNLKIIFDFYSRILSKLNKTPKPEYLEFFEKRIGC